MKINFKIVHQHYIDINKERKLKLKRLRGDI